MDKSNFAPSKRPSFDQLIRLIVSNWIFGVAVGIVWASVLLVFDFAGLRSLILRSDAAGWALAMLFVAFGETFGGVVCATAIMLVPSENETDRPGSLRRIEVSPRPGFIEGQSSSQAQE